MFYTFYVTNSDWYKMVGTITQCFTNNTSKIINFMHLHFEQVETNPYFCVLCGVVHEHENLMSLYLINA